MKKFIYIILLLIITIFPGNVFAQRGCCSHHNGVAGCSSSGRTICKDGSISPSCTCDSSSSSSSKKSSISKKKSSTTSTIKKTTKKSYIYGCTDATALNYNKKATKDDGSCVIKVFGCMDSKAINFNEKANVDDKTCQYESNKVVVEDIPFEIIFVDDPNEFEGKEVFLQDGEIGKKEITYKLIVDANKELISNEKVKEDIILEPTDRIISKGTKRSISNKGDNIFFIGWLFSLIIVFVYYKKYKKNNMLLFKINNFTGIIKVFLYVVYFALVFPVFIDIMLIIINFIKFIVNKN